MVAIAIVVCAFSSCSPKVAFQGSSVDPGARGTVKVTKDRNKNYEINVDLLDMSEPGRLQPAKGCYVVWMVSADNVTTNIGQVKSSSSMFSKALKGSFSTVSSTKPLRVFITAEDQGNTQTPGSVMIMSTNSL